MKRLLIIALVFTGVALVSCSKKQIVPVADESMVVPTWEKALNDDEGDDNDHTKPSSGSGGTEITDPNNDPDGNKK